MKENCLCRSLSAEAPDVTSSDQGTSGFLRKKGRDELFAQDKKRLRTLAPQCQSEFGFLSSCSPIISPRGLLLCTYCVARACIFVMRLLVISDSQPPRIPSFSACAVQPL